jgi:COP9 signalosome complex subunit 6
MSLNVSVHPLVLMNISDQFTRTSVQKGKPTRVVGALFGKQDSRNVEIFNSFELPYEEVKGEGIKIIEKYVTEQLELYKNVFPLFEFIGWYSSSTVDTPSPADEQVHKAMLAYNENPLYLILNTAAAGLSLKEIPLHLFEGGIQIVQNNSIFSFRPLSFRIATVEAERIAVEDVTKSIDTMSADSKFGRNFAPTLNSIRMLKKKLFTLIQIMEKEPAITTDEDFLRKLKSICDRLPLVTSELFTDDLNLEFADLSLLNQVTTITKSVKHIQELVKDFGVLTHHHFY